MALNQEQWSNLIQNAGVPEEQAHTYGTLFATNRLTVANLAEIDKGTQKELGVTILGDQLAIISLGKTPATPYKNPSASASAKLPSN